MVNFEMSANMGIFPRHKTHKDSCTECNMQNCGIAQLCRVSKCYCFVEKAVYATLYLNHG